jgi:hypothetical protein
MGKQSLVRLILLPSISLLSTNFHISGTDTKNPAIYAGIFTEWRRGPPGPNGAKTYGL